MRRVQKFWLEQMGDWLYSPTGKIVKGVMRAKRARMKEQKKQIKKEEERRKEKEERRKKREERKEKESNYAPRVMRQV